jgi:glycosyltransferase involved in cell wall biosynthesis
VLAHDLRTPITALNVLYLVPPARNSSSLAAHSFIDEEIRALRRAGISAYVLTDVPHGATVDGVEIVGLPRPALKDACRLAGLPLRHPRIVRATAGAAPARRVVRALRIDRAAAAVVRRQRIDVIHSHFGWPGGFGGSLAAADTGTPLVASIRGMDVLTQPDLNHGLRLDPAYDLAVRHLLRSASHVVTASSFVRNAALALGAPSDRTTVIPKGVDTDRFAPAPDPSALKTALGLHGPVLLAVGNLKRLKGFDVLLDALHLLRGSEWTAVICGTGEDRAALEAKAHALGIGSRVQFRGQVPRTDIPRLFAAADLFVHASLLEAAGNVVLEALSSGLPVVCTSSGGPAEYVSEGKTGFVVPVGDAPALAAGIDALLGDPRLRERFGASARRVVEDRYSYGRMVRDLLEIYRAAAGASVHAR